MRYKVLHPIINKGITYKTGETVELDEKVAKLIPTIVIPIPDSLEAVEPDELAEEIPVQTKPTNKPKKGK